MNKIFSNVITNYHLTDGGSEYYTTTESDEVVNFEDSDGNKHNVGSIRIDADGSDLIINLVRTDSDDTVLHSSGKIVVSAGSYISYDNIRFNGVKINGDAGQSVKYTGLY